MRRFNFGIGIKLGFSALIGLVLVAGMVGNQARVNWLTHDLANKALRSRELQQAALEARIGLNELISIDLHIRHAATPAEIDAVLEYLNSRALSADKAYDHAITLAAVDDDRRLLSTAKEIFNSYIGAAREIADNQKQIISFRRQQKEDNLAWSKAFENLINSPSIATTPNRFAVENNLQQANSEFKRAESSSWVRFLLKDDGEINRIHEALNTTVLTLEESRAMVRNPDTATAIDNLLLFPPRYRTIVDRLTALMVAQDEIVQGRAVPLREKASTALDTMAIRADRRADELTDHANKETTRAVWINLIVGALVILVMFGVATLSSLMIGRPIRRIAKVLSELASGHNTIVIPYQERGDEVGDASRAAHAFRANLLRMHELESEQQRAVEQLALVRREQTSRLADNFAAVMSGMVSTVHRATGELQGTAKSLTETADVTHQLANSVTLAATVAADNVRSVAMASDQLALSIAEIGQQAERSRDIAGEAVRRAEATDARIAQMSQVADRVGDVLSLITDIAAQTNLLALNATIEAARAGEAGRGFAVVASEVKALASQTARATDEIASQITHIQQVTKDSVVAIKEIGSIIQRVSDIASAITAAVGEQHGATREIAINVQEAAQSTDSVTAKIKILEMDAKKTGEVANEIFTFANELAAGGNTLARQVDNFLGSVRAA